MNCVSQEQQRANEWIFICRLTHTKLDYVIKVLLLIIYLLTAQDLRILTLNLLWMASLIMMHNY